MTKPVLSYCHLTDAAPLASSMAYTPGGEGLD